MSNSFEGGGQSSGNENLPGQPRRSIARPSAQGGFLSQSRLGTALRVGALLLLSLGAAKQAQADDEAVVFRSGNGSYGWEQLDLASENITVITGYSANLYGNDSEFIEGANTVFSSYYPSSGNQGIRATTDPTGASPLTSTETSSLWENVWKINVTDNGNLVFTSTDFSSYSDLWYCDPSSVNDSDCDQLTVPGDGAIAGSIDEDDGIAVAVTNYDGLIHTIDRATNTPLDSAETAPSLGDPSMSYPYDVALDAESNCAYAVSDDTLTAAEYDPSTGALTITEVATSIGSPYDLQLVDNPNTGSKEVWVVSGVDQAVYIFSADGSSSSLITTITLPDSPDSASPLSVGQNGEYVYVGLSGDCSIGIIDSSTYSIDDTISVFSGAGYPGALAVAWSAEDNDGDGYDTTEDCDDTDASVNPGATEVCDGVDNNCDDDVDEGLTTDYYEDADGDEYGTGDAEALCSPEGDYTATVDGDCDDTDEYTNPGADEYCDAYDWDCDGLSQDGAVDTTRWYRDNDGDGIGQEDDYIDECDADGVYDTEDAGDCDDTASNVYPGAPEPDCVEVEADAYDYDCDESFTPAYPCTADNDGDGYESVEFGGTDCDDSDPDINPGATEECGDGVDSDCDGYEDEAGNSGDLNAPTWYADNDGDGFGNPNSGVVACEAVSGEVADNTDFDDECDTCFPGASEEDYGVDGNDNEGDGYVDECLTEEGGTWPSEDGEAVCQNVDIGDDDQILGAISEDSIVVEDMDENTKLIDVLGEDAFEMLVEKNSPEELEIIINVGNVAAAVHGTTPEIRRDESGQTTWGSREGAYDLTIWHNGELVTIEGAVSPGQEVVTNPDGTVDVDATNSQAMLDALEALDEEETITPIPGDVNCGQGCSVVTANPDGSINVGGGALSLAVLLTVLGLRRREREEEVQRPAA